MTKLQALRLEYRIQRRILDINEAIDVVLLKDPQMPLTPKEVELIGKFDVATTAIGNRIAALVADSSQELSPEAQAAFQVEIDKLTALGTDPTQPVGPGA